MPSAPEVRWLGRVPYAQALAMQEQLRDDLVALPRDIILVPVQAQECEAKHMRPLQLDMVARPPANTEVPHIAVAEASG